VDVKLCLVAVLLVGCVFPLDLGNGSLRCGDGNSCPPDQHCAAGRCYRAGSGPSSDAGAQPTDTNGDAGPIGGGGSGGSGGGGGNDLSAVDLEDMSHIRDFSIGGEPRDLEDCVPVTCASVGATCGYYPDGCGTILDCYPNLGTDCGKGNSNGTCAGGGQPYTCGKRGNKTCMPLTAHDCKPSQCGIVIPNGCDDVVVCPPCP
jgi:hypothetical protein